MEESRYKTVEPASPPPLIPLLLTFQFFVLFGVLFVPDLTLYAASGWLKRPSTPTPRRRVLVSYRKMLQHRTFIPKPALRRHGAYRVLQFFRYRFAIRLSADGRLEQILFECSTLEDGEQRIAD